MDREYEATIESEGKLLFPPELQEKFHLKNGSHVRIREQGRHIVIDPVEVADITDLEGWMSPSNAVEDLLRERALDKIREMRSFVFDSYALLVFLNREQGSERVRAIIEHAQKSGANCR
ncbi:MAG TPA: hypothetical protein VFX22_09145 [Candidatus Kapabacteria bacterium]|nr:hypothetical protein [Candidatus Kapabacteria bacterium]